MVSPLELFSLSIRVNLQYSNGKTLLGNKILSPKRRYQVYIKYQCLITKLNPSQFFRKTRESFLLQCLSFFIFKILSKPLSTRLFFLTSFFFLVHTPLTLLYELFSELSESIFIHVKTFALNSNFNKFKLVNET